MASSGSTMEDELSSFALKSKDIFGPTKAKDFETYSLLSVTNAKATHEISDCQRRFYYSYIPFILSWDDR